MATPLGPTTGNKGSSSPSEKSAQKTSPSASRRGDGPSSRPRSLVRRTHSRAGSRPPSNSGSADADDDDSLPQPRQLARWSVSGPKSWKGRRRGKKRAKAADRIDEEEVADILDNSVSSASHAASSQLLNSLAGFASYPETEAAKRQRAHEKAMRRYRRDRARKNFDGVAAAPPSSSRESAADDDGSSSGAARAARVSSIERALRPNAQPDSDDEDFIDDGDVEELADDADAEGSTAMRAARHGPSIIVEHHLSKTEEESFGDVVEWMVQNALNPAFQGDKEKYRIAFQKFDSRFHTCASSAYGSDAWGNDLARALKARPFYNVDGVDARAGCDACHRRRHTAIFRLRLTGTPYNLDTLEPLQRDHVDPRGRAIPPQTKTWYLGRCVATTPPLIAFLVPVVRAVRPSSTFPSPDLLAVSARPFSNVRANRHCKVNTENLHELFHWRRTLRQDVIGYLGSKGYFRNEKVTRRGGMSPKQRQEEVRQAVQQLEIEREHFRLLDKNRKMLDKASAVKVRLARYPSPLTTEKCVGAYTPWTGR